MNANELADRLEQGHWEGGTREQAATMLRQQQTEIQALKTCLIVEQEHNELMVEDRSKYEALAHAGGVEVGKELKTLTDDPLVNFKPIWQEKPELTLTDEEIMVLYEEYIETQYASESNVLGFGRAILRKAQEK